MNQSCGARSGRPDRILTGGLAHLRDGENGSTVSALSSCAQRPSSSVRVGIADFGQARCTASLYAPDLTGKSTAR